MSLDILSKHGVCCAVHVSYPRFRESLDASLFGFQLSDEGKNMVKAPSIRLLAEALKPVEKAENSIRSTFIANTLELAFGTGLRFCPATGMARLCEKLNNDIDVFNEAAIEFVEHFDANLTAVKQAWADTLNDQEHLPEVQRKGILDHVLSVLPANAPSGTSFEASVNWLSLAMPGEPNMQNMDTMEAAAAAEAYKSIREKATQDAQAITSSFLDTCKRELLKRMQKSFTDMSSTVSTGKPVNIRTVRRVTAFVDQIRQLNFMKDGDIERVMSSFHSQCLAGRGNSITNESQVAEIRDSINTLVGALQNVNDGTDADRMSSVLSNVLKKPKDLPNPEDDGTDTWTLQL